MFTNLSLPYVASIIFIFVVGACIGSFLNLVIYRLPLNLSIVCPRSHCPACKKNVPFLGLIPIAGFFLFSGKCFFCKIKIPWSYPFIEFLCALLSSLFYIKYFDEISFINLITRHMSFSTLIPFIISLWLLYTGAVLSVIDIKYRILPDVITLPGIFVGFILSFFNQNMGYLSSLFGIIVGFGGLYLLTKLYEIIRKRQGMGFGDVKYLGFIGAVVGPLGVFYTLLLASIIGSIFGIVYGIITKKGLSASIPFGPFLAVSALFIYVLNFS